MNIASFHEKFISAMVKNGIVPSDPDQVVADGKIHRFHVEGDKPSSKNGWAIIFTDRIAAGAYGSFKLGKKYTWCARKRAQLSPSESAAYGARMKEVQRQRDSLKQRAHVEARKIAVSRWKDGDVASPKHKYLKRKGVEVHGLKEKDGKLLVPMRDADGKLWSIVSIDRDGEKRYQSRARKYGCFHLLGGPITFKVAIAEGYATASTCFEVTGIPTVMAGDSGNLKPVAQAIRAKYGLAEIIFAADNDWANAKDTGVNIGIKYANEAAQVVGGRVAIPIFDQDGPTEDMTDFNDLVKLTGKKALRAAFASAQTVVPEGGKEAFAMNARDFLKLAIPPRKNIVSPWLREGGLVMFHGWRGVGKSLLRDGLAAHMVTGCSTFLCWSIERPISVLVVDGEMPTADVQERIRAAIGSVGKKQVAPFRVLANDLLPCGPIDLRDPVWQELIEREAAGCEVIFLDNVATLAGDSADTNDAASWAIIQRWMIKMRAKGHSIIWLHNDGKGGTQLGTATRETVLDVSIQLTEVKSKKCLKNSSAFGVRYTKPRWFYGIDREPFKVVVTTEKGKQMWSCSRGKGDPEKDPKYAEVIKLHKAKKSLREIEKLTGVPKSSVQRWTACKKSD